MKKLLAILLIFLMIFTLVSCSNGENKKDDEETEIIVSVSENGDSYTVCISSMPKNEDELKYFDLTNEYEAATAVMCTLINFENNFDNALDMLDYIMGPEEPSEYDESFLKNQFEQYPYVVRSYFDGATPENDYEISDEIKITVSENPYSRDEDGYVKLWFKSSGADSERSITLRKKESTGEWFLYSDTYKGITAGIREPKSQDKWA